MYIATDVFLAKVCIELIHVLQVIPAHLFVCKFNLQNNRREYGEVWYSKFMLNVDNIFLMSKISSAPYEALIYFFKVVQYTNSCGTWNRYFILQLFIWNIFCYDECVVIYKWENFQSLCDRGI